MSSSFGQLPAHQGALILSLVEVILENQPALLCPSSLQGHITWDPPEPAKVCSPEIWGCDPAFCPALSSQDLEFHHAQSLQPRLPLTFTSLTSSSLFVSMRSRRFPCWVLSHSSYVSINTFHKLPELLIPCCLGQPVGKDTSALLLVSQLAKMFLLCLVKWILPFPRNQSLI